MLAITHEAAQAMKSLTADPALDGVRIFTAGASQNGKGPDLGVAAVRAPDAGDILAEVEEARLYVEPAALDVLGNSVLNADVEGAEVRFAIRGAGGPGEG